MSRPMTHPSSTPSAPTRKPRTTATPSPHKSSPPPTSRRHPSSSTTQTPLPLSPRRSNLIPRQAIITSWFLCSPFTSSFVEEVESGTAKTTRANTLHNRHLVSSSISSSDSSSECSSPKNSNLASNAPSVSSNSSDPVCKPPVRFSDTAAVYSPGSPPKLVRVHSAPETRPPLEARSNRHQLSHSSNKNPTQPTTTAGRWLVRKLSQ